MPLLRRSSGVAATRPKGGPADGRRLITSVVTSAFGTFAYNVGIAVYAYQQTHSAAWVAAVTVGRYVPALLLSWLISGIADRLPRRATAVAADLGCAVVMVVLAALGSAHAPLLVLTLVAALSSSLARLQAASVLGLVADIIVESRLARTNMLASGGEAVAAALGSATASAILLRFDPWVLFALNSASFVVSALALSAVRSVPPPRPVSRVTGPRPRGHVTAFWPLQLTRTVAAVVNGVDIVLLTVVAARQLNGGSADYGWLLGAAGVGGLMALIPGRRLQSRPTAVVALGGLLLYALPLGLFAFSPTLPVALGIQAARGAGSVLATSSVMAELQRAVPSSMSGRVFGITQSCVLIGTCVGAVGAPLLLAHFGLATSLVVITITTGVVQIGLVPLIHRFDRRVSELSTALDPRMSTLRRLDLLRDASRSTLYAIADGCTEHSVAAGRVIIAVGDVADALYVLVGGSVDVTGRAPEGTVLLRQLTALDHFGEIGLLRGIPRTATVTTTTTCELWRIPGPVLLAAITEAGVSSALTDVSQLRFSVTPALAPGLDGDRARSNALLGPLDQNGKPGSTVPGR